LRYARWRSACGSREARTYAPSPKQTLYNGTAQRYASAIPMVLTRTNPVLCLVLVLVPAGCTEHGAHSTARGREQAKEEYVPVFRLACSEKVKDGLAARFERAQIDVRMLRIQDLSPHEVPDWAKESEGWLILVKPAKRREAETVRKDWFQSLREPAEMSGPVQPRVVPLVLGEAKPLPKKLVVSVRDELLKRRDLDQTVRRDPDRQSEMKEVDTDNTDWLKQVVVDLGWIDSKRFGDQAADAAFLLVQHSGDLPLMLAALPEIEQDVKAGRLNPQNFALLFDRLQIMQGGRQRYGTQVMKDDKGDWIVGRLEEPDQVDERRKEIGLEPLQDYLSRFGHTVRIQR